MLANEILSYINKSVKITHRHIHTHMCVCVYINIYIYIYIYISSRGTSYMSKTDLVMYISHRNDENGRLTLFRNFNLYHYVLQLS